MLKIRNAQMEVLDQLEMRKFEDRMLVHLNQHFSADCKALGENKTREVIRFGIERGRKYDFISEREVCKFVDLMFSFGAEFDTKKPWAVRILSDPERSGPEDRMAALFEEAEKQTKEGN